jgi:hypothetical protein
MGQGLRNKKTKLIVKERGACRERKVRSFLSSKILPYKIEVFTDLNSCLSLWQEFSPRRSLFETLEFRLAFYLGYKYKPYFLVAKRKEENLALLPLWYDEDKKFFTWFGSDWQEENYFFGKEIEAIKVLLNFAPKPLYLNALTKEAIKSLEKDFEFKEDEPKYILDLRNLKSHEDYLMTLKKNDRRDLRKDKNRILKQKPKIIFDNFLDLKELIKLAKERFKQKGEKTDWEDPRRVKTFKKVIEFGGKSYQVRMITVKIGKKTAGVDLIAIFKKRYYALKCGYNVKEFKGIGNFMNLIEIDDAIKLGLEKIDFLQNSYHWKNRWFSPISLFKYEK